MTQYKAVRWKSFLSSLHWQQGEHVVAVAPTGGGKTMLFSRILPRRLYTIMFVTKVRDPTITDEFGGYRIISDWKEIRRVRVGKPNRFMLWPKPGNTVRDTMMRQQAVFGHALDKIYMDGGWTVVVDEMHYLSEMLRLDMSLKLYLHQSRSSNLSMVNGTQRPAYIPVVTYPSSTHGFLWRTTEKRDLDRIGEMGGVDRRELATNLRLLGKHQFVYVNTRDPDSRPVISQVEL